MKSERERREILGTLFCYDFWLCVWSGIGSFCKREREREEERRENN